MSITGIVEELGKRSEYYEGLYKRNTGKISEGLSNKNVLLVGAGSIGSYMAERLVRAGVGKFTICDGDSVELVNLTRSVYRFSDIGKNKTIVLKERLLEINPFVEIEIFETPFQDVTQKELKKAVERCDLIYSAADDLRIQKLLDRIAHYYKLPIARCAVFEGGELGEVVFGYPPVTPCFACTLKGRYTTQNIEANDLIEKRDYETGRVESLAGLGCDVYFVTNIAARVVLAILSLQLDTEGTENHGFLESLMNNGLNRGICTMGHAVFSSGLSARYNTEWCAGIKQKDCLTCGENNDLVDDPIEEIQ